MIKAVCFDVYGTLFDDHKVWIDAVHQIINRNALDCSEEEFLSLWRQKMDDEWQKGPARFKDIVVKGLKDALDHYEAGYEFYETTLFHRWKTIDPANGAVKLLEELNGKYTLIGAAHSSRRLFEEVVAKLPQVFSKVVISDDVKSNKPFPEFYGHVLDAAGAKPDEVVYVTTSLLDAEGALSAGFRVVVVGGSVEGAAMIESIGELTAWVEDNAT